MAKMEISLGRADARYWAGEKISGKAALTLEKAVKYRKIAAVLEGIEMTEIGAGKNRSTEENALLEDTIVLNAGSPDSVLNPGVHELPFAFTLPYALPPTYAGNNANIFYGIRSYVDMPLRLDIKSEKGIVVLQREQTGGGGQLSFASETLNTQKPGFTVSAGKSVFHAGETLTGKITLFNPRGSTVRRAMVKACALEHAKAQWASAKQEVFKAEAEISGLTNGVPREFSLQIPPDAPPSFTSKLSGVSWQLEAWLDLPLGFDVKAKQGMTVLQAPRPSE